ncbi:MFS transporter [Acidianus brierleyi]|uniref:MFS transporter n=1 Tax=Acidianus brierleyi TaxID=41673 RepID=A0A2U9IBA4_9CREN|nr:MFS transporter [Acidianus brierleyi]AWR93298.1 MFS transporter [Acidianus brierleyi]
MNKSFPIISAIIIIGITFSLRASNNMIITTLPLIARYDFHFSSILIGVVSSLAAIFAFISSGLVNSKLKSKLRRRFFVLFSIFYAIIFPLFYFSNPFNIWFFASFLGFSMGLIMPNIMTYAGLFPDQRTRERMLSLYTLALSTSLILGPLIESVVLLKFTLFQAFLFFSLFAILVAIFSFFIKFPNDAPENGIKTTPVWKNPGFELSIALNLMYGIPFGMLTTFGGIFAVESFKASYSLATALFGIFFATSFLGRLILTVIPPRNLWTPIWVAASLTVIGLLLVFISPSLMFYILALVILGIPHGLTYPISLISISRSFSVEERNIANSYFSAIMMGFSSFIPIIISSIVNFFGIRDSFALLIPVALAFILFVIRIFLKQKI